MGSIPKRELKDCSEEELSTSDGAAFNLCFYFYHFHLCRFGLCRISWSLLYGQTPVGLPKKLKQSMCHSYCSDTLFGLYWLLRWLLVCPLCWTRQSEIPAYSLRQCYLEFRACFEYENRAAHLPANFLPGCCFKEVYYVQMNARRSCRLCGGEWRHCHALHLLDLSFALFGCSRFQGLAQ